jgi:predicted Zn-dependent protease
MPRWTLRETLQKIEGLLENGQPDDAAGVCQQVLDSFPKNLAVYRLIGSAYLSDGQSGEAADIFLRLLSSVPDDFTSHLGLGLIREGEGRLDAALWHLERAYEVKPYSQRMQAEVKRLAGRISGAPERSPKLSRIALGRMYLKGHSYPQAIAELQSALAENPQRDDIQVLLAEAYEQAGQPEQALEAGQAVLQKLPYCLQANRILFEAAMHSDQPAQALTYRQRLAELEPYYAFVTPGALRPDLVPEHAVSLEITFQEA